MWDCKTILTGSLLPAIALRNLSLAFGTQSIAEICIKSIRYVNSQPQ